MAQPSVVLLTDRQDKSRALADATQEVSYLRIASTSDTWDDISSMQGVIADVSLDAPDTKRCLKGLSDRLSGRSMPLIYLARAGYAAELYEARRQGATACLSALAAPRDVVSGLFRQIYPGKNITDLVVEHTFKRSTDLFDKLFRNEAIVITFKEFDDVINPILNSIEGSGIKKWLDIIGTHDDFTIRHCLLVAGLAANVALYLGLSVYDRNCLVRAALVHDVGKAKIPHEILNKPGPLTPTEISVMRTHAHLGHEMLISSGMTDAIALDVVRHHHEMLDGSGYPDGLQNEQISDMVRLLTVCDIYAALIECRPYRKPLSQDKALSILNGMTPQRLELSLVNILAASLSSARA